MDAFGLGQFASRLAPPIARRTLAAGAALFRQGDTASAVFVVERGRLALVRHLADGARVVLHVARAGDSFAEPALFSDIYHCDALAEAPSRVAILPKEAVLALLAHDPDLAQALIERLARQVQALRARLELRNVRRASERVWQMLHLAAGGTGNTVTFDRPLKSLAAEIGLTHEAFYRALATLVREGRIRRLRRRIVLQRAKI